MQQSSFSNDFIVRIYRYSRKKHRPFVGVVEKVEVEEKLAFTTYDELWKILTKFPEEGQKGNQNSLKRKNKSA